MLLRRISPIGSKQAHLETEACPSLRVSSYLSSLAGLMDKANNIRPRIKYNMKLSGTSISRLNG
jgi:hypothetical protein